MLYDEEDYKKYLEWLRNEINPKRLENGLEEISLVEAKICWDIMKQFSLSFEKRIIYGREEETRSSKGIDK